MKILIADDELLVRRSIRMFLTDLGVRPDDMVETGDGFGLVEAIGGVGPAYEYVKAALESGRSVVTPNKQLVAERAPSSLPSPGRRMWASCSKPV